MLWVNGCNVREVVIRLRILAVERLIGVRYMLELVSDGLNDRQLP
jgi:hypothetical protein